MTEETQPAAAGAAATAAAAAANDPSAPVLAPWLREILRCPQCTSALSDGKGPAGPELHCTDKKCRRAYRIDDGIPVLLVDESRILPD